MIAVNAGANANYDLSGTGSLTVNGTAYIGGSNFGAGGTGKLNISGGTANIENLKVLNSGAAAPGGTRVNLSGGKRSVLSLDMSGNLERFGWTGGTLDFQGGLRVEAGGMVGASIYLTPGLTLTSNTVFSGGLTANNGQITSDGGAQVAGTPTNPAAYVLGDYLGYVGNQALNSGSLDVYGSTAVGFAGEGHFAQTGGTHTIGGDPATTSASLALGFSGGSYGSYDLSGTGILNVHGHTYIGGSGSGPGGVGVFNMSSGTANLNGLTVFDSSAPIGNAQFNMFGGTLTTTTLNVAEGDRFNLSGGVVNLTGPGSSVTSGQMVVGRFGAASFNQSGGTHDVDVLSLGYYGGSVGNYQLTGGGLTVHAQEFVGYDGVGGFAQTGGTHTVTDSQYFGLVGSGQYTQSGGTSTVGSFADAGNLFVGYFSGSTGAYQLSGAGNLTVIGAEWLGHSGTGSFTQSGGTHTVLGELLIGSFGGNGTFALSSGTLDVGGNEHLGGNDFLGGPSIGSFNQSGGTHTVGYPTIPRDLLVGSEAGASGSYSLSGTGNLTVNGALVIGHDGAGVMNQSGGTINANTVVIAQNAGSTGQYNMSNGTLGALSMQNNGTLDVSGGTVNVGPIDGAGSISVGSGAPASGGGGDIAQAPAVAILNADHIRQYSVTMTGGKIRISTSKGGAPQGVSVLTRIRMEGPARFDLTDNKLIVLGGDIGKTDGPTYIGLTGLIQSAHNFGAWDGPGITTSMPDAIAGLTTIGIATGEQIRGLRPGETDTFAGQVIDDVSVVLMYTYAGDANLDGTIDGGDYGIIDNFVQVSGASGYANGDFNYDSVIDGGDYGIIDNNIQAQGAPFPTSASAAGVAGTTAVPEPMAVTLLLPLLAVIVRRRGRRRFNAGGVD